jgi:hypothetical protein
VPSLSSTASIASRIGSLKRALFVIDRGRRHPMELPVPVGVNPGADGILEALESLQHPAARGRGAHHEPAHCSGQQARPYAGDPKAPLNLVEYGDYECPTAAAPYPIIKRVQIGSATGSASSSELSAQRDPSPRRARRGVGGIGGVRMEGRRRSGPCTTLIFEHQRTLDDAALARLATGGRRGRVSRARRLELSRFRDRVRRTS